jgi:hypothetical protein
MNFMIEFIAIRNENYFNGENLKLIFYLKNGRERAMTVRSHRVGCTT